MFIYVRWYGCLPATKHGSVLFLLTRKEDIHEEHCKNRGLGSGEELVSRALRRRRGESDRVEVVATQPGAVVFREAPAVHRSDGDVHRGELVVSSV